MKKIIISILLSVISFCAIAQPACPSSNPGAFRNLTVCAFSLPISSYGPAAFTVAIPATFSSTVSAANFMGSWNGYSNILSAVNSVGLMPGSFVNYSDSLTLFMSRRMINDSLSSHISKINLKLNSALAASTYLPYTDSTIYARKTYLSSALNSYYTKTASDARYLQSFIESDPVYKADSVLYARKTFLATTLLNYYPASNPSAYISSVPAQSWTSITGKPTFAIVATSGAYADISGTPTIPAAQVQTDWNATIGMGVLLNKPTLQNLTAGTNISIASGVINNTAPDQVVSLTGAGGLIPSGAYPNFTLTQYTASANAVTRPVNSTTWTISSKQALVSYNIKISCTASIGSASNGKVVLQYSTNGGSTWVDCGEVENSNTVTLAIALNSVTIQSGIISWTIPGGALCRMNSTSTGTTTITYIRGQENY